MRTYIYVDGFNLYYRALKRTPFKWLDLSGAFVDLLQSHHDILKIKYFTARVSGRPGDRFKPQRQSAYLEALKRHCGEVELHFGHFLSHEVSLPLADSGDGPRQYAEVIKTEEKGTDVNFAARLLNDGWRNVYDCAIVVTNDSDVAEAMRLVKSERGKRIGLITPGNSHPSKRLMEHADFHRHIRQRALRNNQLPSPIPGTNLTKPAGW